MKPFRTSRKAEHLVKRITTMLKDTGPRPPQWFRSFAASKAVFEQAIGQLFLRGLVLFKGKTSGRVMRLNGRRSA